MIWGNHRGFQYRVAVFDGSDQDTTNTRSTFRTSSRLSYNWFTPEPGVSYTGTTIGRSESSSWDCRAMRRITRTDPKDDAGFTTLNRNYRAWATDIYFDRPFGGSWALTLEGAVARPPGRLRQPWCEHEKHQRHYAQGGLLFPGHVGPGRLQLVARYEDLDAERGVVKSGNLNRGLASTIREGTRPQDSIRLHKASRVTSRP